MAHDRILLKAAESYFATLPPKSYTHGGMTFELPISLDGMVDEALEDYLNQKHIKKIEKNMLKGIVYGNKYSYSTITWKNITLQQMLDNPTSRLRIQQIVIDLTKRGETIFNTNLPKEFLVGN